MLKEHFLKLSKIKKRVFAGAMATALVSTSINIGTFVVEAGSSKNGSVITAYESLPEEIAYQYLPIGSEEFDIEFPDELNVTIYSNEDTEETEEENEGAFEGRTTRREDGDESDDEEENEETRETTESEEGEETRSGDNESDNSDSENRDTGDSEPVNEGSQGGDENNNNSEDVQENNSNNEEDAAQPNEGGENSENNNNESNDNGTDTDTAVNNTVDTTTAPETAPEGGEPEDDTLISQTVGLTASPRGGSLVTAYSTMARAFKAFPLWGKVSAKLTDEGISSTAEGDSFKAFPLWGKVSAKLTDEGISSTAEGDSFKAFPLWGKVSAELTDEGISSVAEAASTLFGPVTVYAAEPEDDDDNDDGEDNNDANADDENGNDEDNDDNGLRELSQGEARTLKNVTWTLIKDESTYSRFQAVRAGDVFVYEPLIKQFGLKSDVELPKIRVTITEEDGSYEEREEATEEATEEETEEAEETVSENEAEEEEEEETVSENEAEETEETVSENEAEEESVSENEAEAEAFDQMMIVGGVRVRVEAPEGVFPAGSTLKVVRLSNSDEETAKEIIARENSDGDSSENSDSEASVNTDNLDIILFDVTILDKDGNEIQPDTNYGLPRVTFENSSIIDKYVNGEADSRTVGGGLSVYHFDDDLTSAEKLDSEVNKDEKSISAPTDHFSPVGFVLTINNADNIVLIVRDREFNETQRIATEIVEQATVNGSPVTNYTHHYEWTDVTEDAKNAPGTTINSEGELVIPNTLKNDFSWISSNLDTRVKDSVTDSGVYLLACYVENYGKGYALFQIYKQDISSSLSVTGHSRDYNGSARDDLWDISAIRSGYLEHKNELTYSTYGFDSVSYPPQPVNAHDPYVLTISAKNGACKSFKGEHTFSSATEIAAITKRSITNATVSLRDNKDVYYYIGEEIKPALVVSDNQIHRMLVEGVDYTVEYTGNKAPGHATITLKGINNYEGSKAGPNFTIHQYYGTLTPLYDGSSSIKTWYPGKVAITAKDYQVSDSESGPFDDSYEWTGNSKNVSKKLYFKYVGDPTKEYYGAVIAKTVGPVNFSTGKPTGTIKVLNKSSSKIQTKAKTVGYTNDSKKKVTITANKNSTVAGVNKTEYYFTDKFYGDENAIKEAASGNWAEYNEGSKPALIENKLNYCYAQFTDNAGNTGYVSTQGVWYDTKDPKVKSAKATPEDVKATVEVKGEDKESGIGNYYVLAKKKTESKPTKDNVKQSGKKSDNGNVEVTGLTANTAYKFYCVIEDKCGNLSPIKECSTTTKETKKEDAAAGAAAGQGGTAGGKGGAGGAGAGSDKLGESNSKKHGVGAESDKADEEEKEETEIKSRIPYIEDATEGIQIGKENTSGWDKIEEETGKAEAPAEIHIDMNGSSVVPATALNSIEGRDITCFYEMGDDVIWAVNGMSIGDKVPDDIDFKVKTDTKNIPSKLVNEVADVYPHKNLSIAYDGEFGFTAIMCLNVGEENAGMYANRYYYNEEEGSLEFIDSEDVDGNGNTEFEFTHASDYTIVIRGDALTEKSAEALVNTSDDGSDLAVSEAADPPKKSNNHWWLLLITILSLILCGVILFMPDKKRQQG